MYAMSGLALNVAEHARHILEADERPTATDTQRWQAIREANAEARRDAQGTTPRLWRRAFERSLGRQGVRP